MSAVFVYCWTFMDMNAGIWLRKLFALFLFLFIYLVLNLPFRSVLEHRTAALPSTYQFWSILSNQGGVVSHPFPPSFSHKEAEEAKESKTWEFWEEERSMMVVSIICCWHCHQLKNLVKPGRCASYLILLPQGSRRIHQKMAAAGKNEGLGGGAAGNGAILGAMDDIFRILISRFHAEKGCERACIVKPVASVFAWSFLWMRAEHWTAIGLSILLNQGPRRCYTSPFPSPIRNPKKWRRRPRRRSRGECFVQWRVWIYEITNWDMLRHDFQLHPFSCNFNVVQDPTHGTPNFKLQDQFPFPSVSNFQGLILRFYMIL